MAGAGQWDDAEATALEILDPDVQREALGAVAVALVAVDRHRGVALAARMEREVRHWTPPSPSPGRSAWAIWPWSWRRSTGSGPSPWPPIPSRRSARPSATRRDEALAVVARALAAVEQWDRAEQAVRTITDADTQAKALGDLAGALADAGPWDRAERVARAIPDLDAQVRTLAALAGALAAIDQDRALAVTDQAEGWSDGGVSGRLAGLAADGQGVQGEGEHRGGGQGGQQGHGGSAVGGRGGRVDPGGLVVRAAHLGQ
jgi:hypothetical protein